MKKLFAIALGFFVLTGCTNKQMYNSTQGAKENECQKILDANDRNRCLDEAHMPYDKYKQQRDESRDH